MIHDNDPATIGMLKSCLSIQDLALEQTCPECKGAKILKVEYSRWGEDCRECEGTGLVLTEFGEQVMSLMRRKLGPMVKDLIR